MTTPTTQSLTVSLAEAVAELDLPDQTYVAEHLYRHAITGERSSGLHCPVANYLAQRTGWRVSVGTSSCKVEPFRYEDGGTPLPPAVMEFIRQFDFNPRSYPDLMTSHGGV